MAKAKRAEPERRNIMHSSPIFLPGTRVSCVDKIKHDLHMKDRMNQKEEALVNSRDSAPTGIKVQGESCSSLKTCFSE